MGRLLYSTGVDMVQAGIYDSGRFNIYICDSESDLPSEGLQSGYLAIVEETKGLYRVNASLQWERENIAAWPVGSVFLAVPATSPSILLGFGTWVEVQQDKIPAHVWRRTE